MNLNHRSKILNTLAYFDVFNHPLTLHEIVRFGGISDVDKVNELLDEMLSASVIFKLGSFYSLQQDFSLEEKRIAGNNRAESCMQKAKKNAKFIAKFPYVKSVMVSGSLSKGVMPLDGDIDFFIITEPNRLWIARSMLVAYKKMFLFNSHKYFCVNYFIDHQHLQIEQQNIFTATEVVTLLPMVNPFIYEDFKLANQWVYEYYSDAFVDQENCASPVRSFFQKISEPILNTKLGDRLDRFFLRITLRKWQKKFKSLSDEDFAVAMQSTNRVSKHHPNNFQRKVLDQYQKKMDGLKALLENELTN